MCIRLDLVKVPCKTGNIKSHFLHQRNQDLPKTVCHDKLELRMISGEMSWMPILWRNASCWLHRQCLRCVSLTKCGNCRVFHHNLMTPLLHFFLLIFLCLFFFLHLFLSLQAEGWGFYADYFPWCCMQKLPHFDLIYRVIQNDCQGFNNLSHTIHLR